MENHWVGGRKEHREDQEEGGSMVMLPPPPLLLLLLAQTADAIALNADSREGDGNLNGA
jgi:hypothetical protein